MRTEQPAVVKCAAYITVHDSYTVPRDKGPCFLITPSFLATAVFRSQAVDDQTCTRKEAFTFSLGTTTKKLELKMHIQGCFVKMGDRVTLQVKARVI